MLLNNQEVIEEVNEEINYQETNDNENKPTHNLWDAVKTVLREVYGNTNLPQ